MKKLSQSEWIAVSSALIVVVVIFFLFVPFRFFDTSTQSAIPGDTNIVSETVMNSGLVVRDITLGEGAVANDGQILVVHYVGLLADGTQFDSSVDRGQPFAFILGRGDVIRGWDDGLKGMRVGGRRVIIIPSELGYGATGAGSIPPNATLIFEVILLDVRDAPTE